MTRCRGCRSSDVRRVVDLGAQPGADYFPPAHDPGDDPRWPLELWHCAHCSLVQLGAVTPQLPEPPLAIESATSRAHAEASVKRLLRDHPDVAGGTVFEFASHHGGSWLGHLAAAGCRVVGGDERARLVVDVHGIAHEPDVLTSLRQRADRLATGGLLVLEFHHLLPLFLGTQFDTVRHGHWSYFSIGAVRNLAATMGLTVVSVEHVDQFGGSVQVSLRHTDTLPVVDESVPAALDAENVAGIHDPATLTSLQHAAMVSAVALGAYLRDARSAGRTVLGYGAPSKAPVLLDLSGVGRELLPFTVDASPAKHGRRIPGCGVPIRPVADLVAARPDLVLVLTWDIAEEVVGQLEAAGGWGAEYLVPLPEPHLLDR